MPRPTISILDLRRQTEQLLSPTHPIRLAISELPDELDREMYDRLAKGWLKVLAVEMVQTPTR